MTYPSCLLCLTLTAKVIHRSRWGWGSEWFELQAPRLHRELDFACQLVMRGNVRAIMMNLLLSWWPELLAETQAHFISCKSSWVSEEEEEITGLVSCTFLMSCGPSCRPPQLLFLVIFLPSRLYLFHKNLSFFLLCKPSLEISCQKWHLQQSHGRF